MAISPFEKFVRYALEPFPGLKRGINRAYQAAGYALSREKLQSEGDITRLSPDDGQEYFFGYYDKSPWDADDRRVIALRVHDTTRSPAPAEPGELVLIDTADGGRVYPIATVHAWNVQQGCMAQWLGPDFKRCLIYNDFRDGRYCAVVFDTLLMREIRTLPRPVYDVSRDGRFALSLDFSRLHRLRPGYGYANLPDETAREKCPSAPCIWRMDIITGAVKPLMRYTDFAEFEPNPTMVGAEHKVNHLMLSPDGTRFMALHRWFDHGHKHTRLVTVNVDGSDMYNLADDGFVSHCFWKNDHEILGFLRKPETGNHYYLMRDMTREYRLLWPELARDGHCSYSPDGLRVVTDTYPDRARLCAVYLCSEAEDRPARLARVFSPLNYRGDCRCDLHPRWNRAGDRICIDSAHEGKRALYVIPAQVPAPAPKPLKVLMINTVPIIYDGITMSLLKYVGNMNRDGLQIDFLAINDVEPSIRETLAAMGCRLHVVRQRNRHPLRYFNTVRRIVRDNGYDIVHAHGNSATLAVELAAARLGGAKVRCAHSRNTKCKYVKIDRLLRPVFNRLYTHAFACGEAAGKWLFGNRPFAVLTNGTDTGLYRFDADARAEYREKLGIGDKIAVGCVAHFTYHKNHGFLIEAFEAAARQNPNLALVLVGDGKYRGDIEEMVRQKHLENRVIFTGTTREVPQILSAMDLMVLPSLYEGMPNVVIEWQVSGLPALVADTVTTECQLTDLVRFLPLEVSAWAEAMASASPIEDRNQSSLRAVEEIKAAGFDIRENAERLRQLYFEYADAGKEIP